MHDAPSSPCATLVDLHLEFAAVLHDVFICGLRHITRCVCDGDQRPSQLNIDDPRIEGRDVHSMVHDAKSSSCGALVDLHLHFIEDIVDLSVGSSEHITSLRM